MTKTILITGATDGIGLEAAKMLSALGQRLLIHGRNKVKLEATKQTLTEIAGAGPVETYLADLSDLGDVEAMASAVAQTHDQLDVLINNAGVYSIPAPIREDGHDLRFIVNVIAPYLLTKRLLPLIPADGRIVNLSSAAQEAVNLAALQGKTALEGPKAAYAQSKLAITMWSFELARLLGDEGPVVVAVNPASLLATNMVRDAYGIDGNDVRIGGDILARAALSDEFANASGTFYDNDNRRFSNPHGDALDASKNKAVVAAIEAVLEELQG